MVRLVRTLVLCIGLIGNSWLGAQEANQPIGVQPTQEQPMPDATAPEEVTPPIPSAQAPEQTEGVQPPAPAPEPPATQPVQPEPAPAIEPVMEAPAPTEVPPAPQEQPTEPVPAPQPAPEAVPVEEPQPEPEIPQPPLGPDEIMGIDTVDLESPQGNWLYKRVWWEKAEKLYEKIRNAVNKILEMRTGFFAKRAELDKTVLDPFYIKIGLSQGELQEILSELIARLTKETKTRESQVAEEAIEEAESDKQELQRLQKEVEQVVKHDGEVEDAIIMLVEQINKIRRLEQDAWQNFKSIARVLDDKKARELFYKVDNAWRNIQELQNYIDQTYSSSFDQLIERIKERIKKIDSTILSLKEKGVDLKQRILSRIEQEEMEEEEEAPKKGIFTRYIIDPIKSVFSAIWGVIRWPIDKIMGRTAAPAEEEQEEEIAVEEQEPAAEPTQAVEGEMPAKAETPVSEAPQPVLEDVIEEEVTAAVEEPSADAKASDFAEATTDMMEDTAEMPEKELAPMPQPEDEMEPEPATDELEATIEEEE